MGANSGVVTKLVHYRGAATGRVPGPRSAEWPAPGGQGHGAAGLRLGNGAGPHLIGDKESIDPLQV
jgi:hypothetical protein